MLVEDFENVSEWGNNGTSADLASVNGPSGSTGKVGALSHSTVNVSASFLDLGSNELVDGSVGTIFFRVHVPSNPSNQTASHWFGFTDNDSPQAFGDMRGYGGHNGNGNPINYAFRNGSEGTTVVVESNSNYGQWYNVWLVVDNQAGTGSDSYDVYVNQGTAAASVSDRIATDYAFRNGGVSTALDTVTLFGANAGGSVESGREVFYDDLYVDISGANLANVIPEPSTMLMLCAGIATLGMLRRKRRS